MNATQYVGLNILLQGSANIGIIVEQQEADRLMREFSQGTLAPVLGSHNVRCHQEVPAWTVYASKVAGMHLFDPSRVAGVQGTQTPPQQKSAVVPGQFPPLTRQDRSGFHQPKY